MAYLYGKNRFSKAFLSPDMSDRRKRPRQTDRQTDFHTPNALLETTSLLMPPAHAGGQKNAENDIKKYV